MLRVPSLVWMAVFLVSPVLGDDLHEAVESGDMAQVQALIAAGADVDAKGPNQATPLILASLEGHSEVVKFLLDKDANIGSRNEGGLTALHAATYRGHFELVEILVTEGGDLNDGDNRFQATPLHMAAEENHLEIATFLISHGANMEAKERNGYTPITRATFKEHANMIALLRQKGAECQPKDLLGDYYYDMCMGNQN